MDNDLSSPEKEDNPKENHRHLTVDDLTNYPIPSESLKSIQATSDAINKSMNLAGMMPGILKVLNAQNRIFDKMFASIAFQLSSTTTVYESIGRLIATETPYINEMLKVSAFQEQFFQSQIWKDQQNTLSKVLENFPLDVIWRSHLIDISKFALLSETALSHIELTKLGNALDIGSVTRNRLRNSFANFSQSYATLYNVLEDEPSIIIGLPPVLSKLPAVEFFNGVMVIDRITLNDQDNEDDVLEAESKQVTEETKKETEDRLEFLLTELNTEFLAPLQGARLSLISGNPDRTRHFAISLRELFTQVLHTVAPDDKVKAWSTEPKHYDDKGRPTRRVRLLYASRVLNQDIFFEFIESDVEITLKLLNLFQKGAHELNPRFTDAQLMFMFLKMEITLRYLLEIWRLN